MSTATKGLVRIEPEAFARAERQVDAALASLDLSAQWAGLAVWASLLSRRHGWTDQIPVRRNARRWSWGPES